MARTISQLIFELSAMEQEFGDLPVKVEVFKTGDKDAVDYQSDFPISSVMEDPLIEGVEDGVMLDSYGDPVIGGPTAAVITLETDLVWKDGVVYGTDPRLDKARRVIGQVLKNDSEYGLMDLQSFYEELCDEPKAE